MHSIATILLYAVVILALVIRDEWKENSYHKLSHFRPSDEAQCDGYIMFMSMADIMSLDNVSIFSWMANKLQTKNGESYRIIMKPNEWERTVKTLLME